MSGFAVRGWCPTAWRPMMAGDGLLIRVRPRLARLTRQQGAGLCALADRHGNGMIDVTSRANLQIRGVGESGWPALLDGLVALDLVDADRTAEARRTLIVAPDWAAGDETVRVAAGLMTRLGDLPDLPAKMGFAVDAGKAPVLGAAPADFRIERGESGGLILRADGQDAGASVHPDAAVDAMVALAHWFIDTGGAEAGRMARHHVRLPDWAAGTERPAAARAPVGPGYHPLGRAYGVVFGSMAASALVTLMDSTGADAVRVTPWRVLLLEGAGGGGAEGRVEGFVEKAGDPAMRADACPGKPLCPQATVETRPLALRLAPHVEGRLHVSGCAKGCACGGPANVTLSGCDGLFNLAFDARAGDGPVRSGLYPHDLLAEFGAD